MRKRDVLRAERRAAEIAASVLNFWPSGALGRWPSNMRGVEMAGWMRAGDNRERGCKEHDWRFQAGFLAARIWFETAFENLSEDQS